MRVILGMILGAVLLCLAVFCYFWLGFAPTATNAPPLPFEQKIAMHALHTRADKEAPKNAPANIPVNDVTYMAGANVYVDDCSVCHGLPGQGRTAIAGGMYPRPPQLFRGEGVTDDPPGETYWKVKNGIRLTGMPAFKDTLTDEQMWQVSILLANADKIDPSTKKMLETAQPSTTAKPAANQQPQEQDKSTTEKEQHHH